MKTIPKEERCSELYVPDWSGWHFSQCSRRGTITEESRIWCFQHAPSKIKARQAKSAARFKANQDRHMAPYDEAKRLRAVNAQLLAALKKVYSESHDPNIERIAQAAIKQAKGE